MCWFTPLTVSTVDCLLCCADRKIRHGNDDRTPCWGAGFQSRLPDGLKWHQNSENFPTAHLKLTELSADRYYMIRNHKVLPITRNKGMEGKERYTSTLSLTSALDVDGWLTPRPGRSTPGKRPGTNCTEGWVNPRTGVDGCGKSRPPHRGSIHRPSCLYQVTIQTELSRLTNKP
jgi:hypothetical protein